MFSKFQAFTVLHVQKGNYSLSQNWKPIDRIRPIICIRPLITDSFKWRYIILRQTVIESSHGTLVPRKLVEPSGSKLNY